MQIKYNIIPKSKVRFCLDTYSIEKALEVLENSGYRCIPVLSADEKTFRGNIYAQLIYQALWRGTADIKEPVTTLLEDTEVFIQERASFFRIFSSIKKYPYLAVTDELGHFTGILTHANVMGILEDSWGIKKGNHTMTISTQEYQGALSAIMAKIKDYTSIYSMMTLDNESTFFRRVIITLPKNMSEEKLTQLIGHLEDEGFRVSDVEQI
ncbi:MAG: CBS domain-containing protein [Alkalicoccus sp.]|nr:MAG: CBS domain-containing protein [Alkalicoccus sp.]